MARTLTAHDGEKRQNNFYFLWSCCKVKARHCRTSTLVHVNDLIDCPMHVRFLIAWKKRGR